MRSRKGNGAMAGANIHPISQLRHAELVSASIVPHAQVLRNHPAVEVCAFEAPVQTDGWTLKQVQGDGNFEVFG